MPERSLSSCLRSSPSACLLPRREADLSSSFLPQDLLTEEPRPGLKPIKVSTEGRLLTQAVWLNNNTLSDLTDFTATMGKLLEYPEDISWIDLSFNDLSTIDPVV